MKKLVVILATIFAAVVSSHAIARLMDGKSMTDKELSAVKAQLNRPDVTDAWAMTGYNENDRETKCLTRRVLYIYSKPLVVQRVLLKVMGTKLVFDASRSKSGRCGELHIKEESRIRAGRYIYQDTAMEIIAKHDTHDFFKIHGQVNDNQLVALRNVIDTVASCISRKKGCDSVNLNVKLPTGETNRVNDVQGSEISSIEGQVSPTGDGPYIILFRPYTAEELVVFVTELTRPVPSVQVTILIP